MKLYRCKKQVRKLAEAVKQLRVVARVGEQ